MSKTPALLRPAPVLDPVGWTAKELPRGTLRPFRAPKDRGIVFRPDRPVPALQSFTAKILDRHEAD